MAGLQRTAHNLRGTKEAHCVGVSEAAHEVNFLEHCLHGGHTALLGTQADQHYAPSGRHCIKSSLHTRETRLSHAEL